jgi:hypothetical protein
MPVHLHTITDPTHTHVIPSGSSSTGGSSVTGQSNLTDLNKTSGASSTGITQTNNAGSGTAHNVIQPMLMVTKIIKT